MKKIISLILVAVMLTFAFSSCELLAKLKPKEETRYTITSDEWAALCSELNYTAVSEGTSTIAYNGETDTTITKDTTMSTATGRYESIKGFTEEGEEEYNNEYYYTTQDDVRYRINYWTYEERWVGSEYDWESESIVGSLGLDEEIKFEDLVYNADKKAYTYTVTQNDITGTVDFYFENGKLVKMVTVASGSFINGNITMTATATQTTVFSNIGTTVVTIPEYTVN